MTATEEARRPFELMNEAEELLDRSIALFDDQATECAEIVAKGGVFRSTPLGYIEAGILAEQASALIALARARMLGQGRA